MRCGQVHKHPPPPPLLGGRNSRFVRRKAKQPGEQRHISLVWKPPYRTPAVSALSFPALKGKDCRANCSIWKPAVGKYFYHGPRANFWKCAYVYSGFLLCGCCCIYPHFVYPLWVNEHWRETWCFLDSSHQKATLCLDRCCPTVCSLVWLKLPLQQVHQQYRHTAG